MTDTAAPEGGWAQAPRPPLTVVLTEAQVRALTSEGVRAAEHRPLLTRLVVAVGLGALIAVTFAPSAGVLTAAVLIALAVGLFVVRRRMIEGSIAPGSARTTGYDRQGSFVVAGTQLVVLARGSVAGWNGGRWALPSSGVEPVARDPWSCSTSSSPRPTRRC